MRKALALLLTASLLTLLLQMLGLVLTRLIWQHDALTSFLVVLPMSVIILSIFRKDLFR